MSGDDRRGANLMSDSIKKEQEKLESSVSLLMEQALKAGADDAEVCGAYNQKSRISLEKQDFHLATADDGYLLGIRVLCGKKQGFASTNSLQPQELKEIAGKAVEIAKVSPENPFFSIGVSSSHNSPPTPLHLWDSSLAHISMRTQKDWAQWMKNEILKDSKIRLNEGS